MKSRDTEIEIRKAAMEPTPVDEQVGEPSGFTCPECQGGLWELNEGKLVRYRCRVGHAYSADSLAAAYGSSVEASLWAALRALEENAEFSLRLAERAKKMGRPGGIDRFSRQAQTATEHARVLRDILARGVILAETSEEVIAPE